jgi:hypothetical protein
LHFQPGVLNAGEEEILMAQNYRNFTTAVYCTVNDVIRMQDTDWLTRSIELLQKSIKIDKVYLETYRSMVLADKAIMENAKAFFADRGIKTSGGITTTAVTGKQDYQSFCYANPEHRRKMKEISTYTAELFDEVMLDDFFFYNCSCERCIEAKGDKSWTEYRLEAMAEVSENLVIAPAKQVNPNVNMIIKYPNWYDHYHFIGYNLEKEPKLFDMIYTGTETRDAQHTHQHLQPYLSYGIMRFLENVKPGKNGGGWIDPFARRTLDRYAEQIRLTLFAKSREVTLFCFGALLDPWGHSAGSKEPQSWVAPVAGNVFDDVDSFLDELGEPYGIDSYKPYHSHGEDFLHNYIGTLGIPIELKPEFPADSQTIFLTECAKFDVEIVDKIKRQLLNGKIVIITSGLLKALQDKGLEDITQTKYTDKKVIVNTFSSFREVHHSTGDIMIPQIKYATNDSWEVITCLKNQDGYPLLLRVPYADGNMYVLTIPETVSDLYDLPRETLTQLKEALLQDLPVHVESEGKVSLFTYKNDTCIVESFLPHNCKVNVVLHSPAVKLFDLKTGKEISGYVKGDNTIFPVPLRAGGYCAFRYEYA